jgi:uncharacterized membrane protein YdjX (TVP38/TMEM64 family)
MIEKMKKALFVLWLVVLVGFGLWYSREPELFTAENILSFLSQFKGSLLVAYFAASILRGLTLLPSTLFVMVGIMMFPGEAWWVLAISLSGILASATMIYFFSHFLGFDKVLGEAYQARKLAFQRRFNSPFGTAFVAAWSFFPILPTDLICYAAGTLQMHFAKFIIGILIGEGIICGIYIFTGKQVITWLA